MAVLNENGSPNINNGEPFKQQNEEKRKEAKIKKEAEKEKERQKARLKNGVFFVRKDTRPGIYSTNGIGKRLKIRDRGHYFTKIDSEIRFFDNDPEIIELDSKSPKK